MPIIEHADVRRMLLAQKSYFEGALALELYCARLVDEQHTGDDAAKRATPRLLLEVLTPIAKSWPSEWCLEANSLAIQVLGGYGYTRDFPVEQYWRDNRLNMIHEGTHGIQALDLLGRKVVMDERRRPQAAAGDASARRSSVRATSSALAGHAEALAARVAAARSPRPARPGRPASPQEALANATPYLQAFGHVVHRLDLARRRLCAAASADDAAQRGRLAACRYFFHYELPKIGAWLGVVERRDDTCRRVAEDEF